VVGSFFMRKRRSSSSEGCEAQWPSQRRSQSSPYGEWGVVPFGVSRRVCEPRAKSSSCDRNSTSQSASSSIMRAEESSFSMILFTQRLA